MKKQNYLNGLLAFLLLMVGAAPTLAEETTYAPTLDVSFRTNSGNTDWNSGFPKSAADDGNTDFELTYTAGLFALQKYTVPNLQKVTKLVLTLTVGSKSGVDAVRVWSFPNTTWTTSSDIDDIVPTVTTVLGIAPRDTEGTANTPLVTGSKVTESDPAKATFTIQGDALATIKANAAEDGTFTLLLTNNDLKNSDNKRSYLSNNSANDVANCPSLVATYSESAVYNKTTHNTYDGLNAAFSALTAADTELEVYGNQVLTARCTWGNANTLTITPMKDITITGPVNAMWFLTNVDGATLKIGSATNKITFDGQNNTMGYDVTKGENSSTLSLTNVTFKDFNLNSEGHLVGSKESQDVKLVLDKVTINNCSNPSDAYIYKLRVKNDFLELKGYLNQESSTGTTIYSKGETKEEGTTGRIKINDNSFTANADISVNFAGVTNGDGVVVVIGTAESNASKFKLTSADGYSLVRKSNGDLFMSSSHNVNVGTHENGTLKIGDAADNTSSTALYGSTVTFSATPAGATYQLSAVSVKNGVDDVITTEVSAGNYSFTMPSADVTVNATFALKKYTLTIGEMTNGKIQIESADAATAQYDVNTEKTLTAYGHLLSMFRHNGKKR